MAECPHQARVRCDLRRCDLPGAMNRRRRGAPQTEAFVDDGRASTSGSRRVPQRAPAAGPGATFFPITAMQIGSLIAPENPRHKARDPTLPDNIFQTMGITSELPHSRDE